MAALNSIGGEASLRGCIAHEVNTNRHIIDTIANSRIIIELKGRKLKRIVAITTSGVILLQML